MISTFLNCRRPRLLAGNFDCDTGANFGVAYSRARVPVISARSIGGMIFMFDSSNEGGLTSAIAS